MEEFVASQAWDLRCANTLLAVSGGLDSIAMAEAFRLLNWPSGIAHVNYQLRGADSDLDAEWVEAYADQHQIPFHLLTVNTRKLAKAWGLGIQETARHIRYEWLEEVRSERGYDYIATAHHADDHIETSLFRWMRGTGLRGLCGIPIQRDAIIRPLLSICKSELLAFAQDQELVWREDASNTTSVYQRNAIRHHVLPAIEQVEPRYRQQVKNTLAHLKEANCFVRHSIRQWEERIITAQDGYWEIDVEVLPLPIRGFVLYESLSTFGFRRVQIDDLLNAQVGSLMESQTHYLYKDRLCWLLQPRDGTGSDSQVYVHRLLPVFPYDNGSLEMQVLFPKPSSLKNTNDCCQVNADQITFPLCIRAWRAGDAYRPLGMDGHSKKLKKSIVEWKLNAVEKQRLRVLVNGDGNIIWVIGKRADERFKVRPTTDRILQFTHHNSATWTDGL